ncbi:MAG: amidohydrolase [Bacteroidales bacterium]|nr:amidohydrolase [Bacteroidales bacterium]
MDKIKNRIKNLATEYLRDIISVRRHLHKFPELSFEEHNTSEFISAYLSELVIPHKRGIAKTGIVGLIEGRSGKGKVVALRADMDALPVREQNEVEYKSAHDGIMHACGHDVHMAGLMGAARILNEMKDDFGGIVKLIFQPSEETYPGGAKVMIEEGVLENPKPDVIIGQHVYPDLKSGHIGMKGGNYMASTDEIYLRVTGKGGHAATPFKNIDPVLTASHILVALQQVVSRNANPGIPTVLSFGRFIADGRTNVIPDTARLDGIMRTFDEQWRSEMKQKITRMAKGIAEGMGAHCEVVIDPGYPVLHNDENLTQRVMGYARDLLGDECVHEIEARTTAEDFAYLARAIPGCFYRLGVNPPDSTTAPNLHTSTFNVDESSLHTAMSMMAWTAIHEMKLTV